MKKTLCFLSGMILALSALLCAVILPALSADRFEQALLSTVDRQALGMSESSLSAFAEETMRYLRGQKPAWEPDVPFPVAESFHVHMAEVRGWVSAAPWGIGLGLLVGLGLLWLGGWQRRSALWGVYALVGLVIGVLIWAAADFASFWRLLHRFFIPGGIFAAHEPVMQLFPLSLFFRYVTPVAVSMIGHVAALWTGLCILTKKREESQ